MMMGKLTAKANAGITERINAITWKIDGIAGRTESIVVQVIVKRVGGRPAFAGRVGGTPRGGGFGLLTYPREV